MASTSFKSFPLLPRELRNEIYFAALPQSRIVRIEGRITGPNLDDESKYDNMIALAKKEVVKLGEDALHNPPKACADLLSGILKDIYCDYSRMLQRFQILWSDSVFWVKSKTGGITYSTRPARSMTPIVLLEECGRTVIDEATRISQLWSHCPIPALLRTCRESRRAMQLCGYELAFSTSSSEPMTWFNFKHDVLYFTDGWSRTADQNPNKSPGHLDKFSPKDLARVERVAATANEYNLINAIPIFGNLQELLMVLVHIPAIGVEAGSSYWMINSPADPNLDRWWHHETERDLWGYMESEVIEFLDERILKFVGHYNYWEHQALEAQQYRIQNHGDCDDYWATKSAELEDKLQSTKNRHSGSWKIPSIRYVYIVTKKTAGIILGNRNLVANEMHENETLENEEGPRPENRIPLMRLNYWAPFVEECDALEEIRVYESLYFHTHN